MNVPDQLGRVSIPARKLFTIIVRQARHGSIRPKPESTALPAEILETCGLDVGEFYDLLNELSAAGLIRTTNAYPFEEIQLTADAAGEALAEGQLLPAFDTFAVPPERRYFEDYAAGRVYEFGAITVTGEEIIEFAKVFDPQYFHVNPVKAAASQFGGIIASGWHTASLTMRLYADHYLSHVASLASPGIDELRWPNPLRPGDTARIRVTVLETRFSRSKPDRGIVRARVETINQRDEVVLSMNAVSILARRDAPAMQS
jgi:acyl dehydratase